MKKKYIVFLFICAFTVILSGCFGFQSTSNTTNTNNQTVTSVTSNINPQVAMPKSANSIYKEPVKIEEGATATDIANAYIDSVVTIFVVNSYDVELSFGSGVCVYSGGYILTNNHVVSDVLTNSSYELRVCLNGESTSYYAEVLWTDASLDIAIIQCQNGNIPFVKIQDRLLDKTSEPLQLLEPVIAIGTPLDFSLQNSCTYGYISGLNRYTTADNNVYEQIIQHTASISKGNSGGPLFDMQGNLVGLNTLGSVEGNDIYFAVPVYSAQLILQEVVTLNEQSTRQAYKMPQLGITLCDEIMCMFYNENYIDTQGVYVMSVTMGGNSYAKLQTGDIIKMIAINDDSYTIDCRNDLIYSLLMVQNNQSINVTVQRNNKLTSVTITLN